MILVAGNRSCGKSYLVRDILTKKKIGSGLVMSGTEENYSEFLPSTFTIQNQFDESEIKSRLNTRENEGIVLDDIDASNWTKNETMRKLIINGRHLNKFRILTLQDIIWGISPDYIFLFGNYDLKIKKQIYEEYCGMIPTFEKFNSIYEQCTKNYECMVIKLTGHSDVFYYRAETK